MKYVKTYESFKSRNKESINEEFIGSLFSGIFKKIKDTINKTKGGKEIEEIYQKHLKTIQDQIQKDTKLNLDIEGASKGEEKKPEATEVKKENKSYSKYNKINEQISVDDLKKQQKFIQDIIKKNQALATTEMNNVLKKYGGSASNPSLAALIDSKKLQFEIDVLNSQVQALQSAGDTKSAEEFKKQSEEKSKEMQKSLEEGLNKKPVEYKVGDEVVYIMKDKKDEWEKLTPEQKKKTEEEPAKKLVGGGKITKIEGDKFIIQYGDKEGEVADKTSDQIISKKEVDRSEEAKKAAESLGKIKDDPDKMNKVAKFADLLADDANKSKIEEIEKLMTGES
jgi:hypothetical protein